MTKKAASIVRDSIEITLLGTTYVFERPVISQRRRFQKDGLRVAEIYSQMDFANGTSLSDGEDAQYMETPKNLRLFMECVDVILEIFVKYCPAIARDEKKIRDALDNEELTDGEIGIEFGKMRAFANAPSSGATKAAKDAPATTSAST